MREPSLDPPEPPGVGEMCPECGQPMPDGGVPVDFGRKPLDGSTVYVCTPDCEAQYLAGWGDYMYDMMSNR